MNKNIQSTSKFQLPSHLILDVTANEEAAYFAYATANQSEESLMTSRNLANWRSHWNEDTTSVLCTVLCLQRDKALGAGDLGGSVSA